MYHIHTEIEQAMVPERSRDGKGGKKVPRAELSV